MAAILGYRPAQYRGLFTLLPGALNSAAGPQQDRLRVARLTFLMLHEECIELSATSTAQRTYAKSDLARTGWLASAKAKIRSEPTLVVGSCAESYDSCCPGPRISCLYAQRAYSCSALWDPRQPASKPRPPQLSACLCKQGRKHKKNKAARLGDWQ